MRRLVITTPARQDPLDIDLYVMRSSGDVGTARRFTRHLQDRCHRLAALPGTLGANRPDLGPHIRMVVHQQHLILFRYEPGILRVLRIIEGHRDIGRNLLPPEA